MKENVSQKKSFEFAEMIASVCKSLIVVKGEYVFTKQLIRSGFSIGTNVGEAFGGQTKRDFIAKISFSCNEACGSKYWTKSLATTQYLVPEKASELLGRSDELTSIISPILIFSKSANA